MDAIPSPKKPHYNHPPPQLCFCKSIGPSLIMCRLFGLFPISFYHDSHGICQFRRSHIWTAYNFTLILLFLLQLFLCTDAVNIMSISEGKSLHALLSAINDITYVIYTMTLLALNLFRSPRFVRTFNELSLISREVKLCQSSMKVILLTQYGYIAVIVFVFAVQYGALSWLHFSDSYETDFDMAIVINRSTQNVTCVFYVLFSLICTVFVGILGCFEKLTISTLEFTPVHPLKAIDETNNLREFLGVIRYTVCNEVHKMPVKVSKLLSHERVEYLRILHEEISHILSSMNQCLNPQFLFHTMVELTVLVIHWYAVVLYFAFEFSTPIASTIHFLNCYFVFVHTAGLFLFLKNAQHLQNVVKGLTNFLIEYSTRITTIEEHQQIRFFIEKLKFHKPINASGVFDIDLGIAGPICANILTYVLVALQFDVPKT